MRHYLRDHRDANYQEIVGALKQAGCAVWPLARPVDLLVWRAGQHYLVEIKNPHGFDRLTVAQKKFRSEWPGEWFIVRTSEEALQVVGAIHAP